MLFIPDRQLELTRSGAGDERTKTRRRVVKAAKGHLNGDLDEITTRDKHSAFVWWDVALGELAAAHLLTDDDRYQERAIEIARRLWTDAPGWKEKKHLPHPWTLSILATFLDRHRHQLDEQDLSALEASMEAVAQITLDRVLNDWGDPDRIAWNHMAIAYSAIAKAGLVLSLPSAERWREVGLTQLARFLDIGVTPAGMTWEGLTYCGFVLRHLAPVVNGLRSLGQLDELMPEGSSRHERLLRIPEWYAHSLFPHGSWLQNFGDSTWDPHRAMWGFLPMFTPMRPDLALAVWDRLLGASGLGTYGRNSVWSSLADDAIWLPEQPPDPSLLDEACALERTFHCPDVGFVITRDRWGPEASVLAFNAGPFPWRMHDHSDNTSFTYIAAGTPVVLDAGAGTKLEEGSPSSTFGHNLVLIDGVGHVPSGQSYGCSGRIVAVSDEPGHLAVVGDAKESYDQDGHNPVRWAFRHAVLLRSTTPCLLVIDDIDKDGELHDFTSLLHLPWMDEARAAGPPEGELLLAGDPEGDAPGVVQILHPAQIDIAWTSFGRFHKPWRTQRLCTVRTERPAVNPHFVTLVTARPTDLPDADVFVAENTLEVRLAWHSTTTTVRVGLHRPGGLDPAPAEVTNS